MSFGRITANTRFEREGIEIDLVKMYSTDVKTTWAILMIWCSVAASAQVKIGIPERHYKSHDKIDVEIANTGFREAAFCVEYGYMSFVDSDHSEPTPTPVYVQQKGAHRWNTLMTGPDIGSSVQLATLAPGESQHYPFRVNAHGIVRVVLDYWIGATGHSCGDRKGSKSTTSRDFAIE